MGQRIVPVTMGSPRFRSIEIPGLRVTEAEFAPCDVLPPHVHERSVLGVMLEGSFDLHIRRAARPCPPGTVLIEPGGERHFNHLGRAGARALVIEPAPLYEREMLDSCRAVLAAPATFAHPPAAAIARRLRRELFARDGLVVATVEALVVELVGTAAARTAPHVGRRMPPWLARARELVHDSPLRALRVMDIAAEVGIHPVYLTRVFRRHFGVSLGTYQRRRRLEWAAARLAAGDRIAAVAHRAGFADQPHFTRAFKRFSGETPARFQKARPHRFP